jgi:hypothetical protein
MEIEATILQPVIGRTVPGAETTRSRLRHPDPAQESRRAEKVPECP